MSKGRLAQMLTKANPSSIAYSLLDEKEQTKKLTLAEKVHMIHGSPKWKHAQEEYVMRHWAKLAGAMTQGVTNIMRGRSAGAAGISMAKVPGKALSQQVVNPNRSLKSSLNIASAKPPVPPKA